MTNLDYWHIFETENPEVFFFTYQFWVRASAAMPAAAPAPAK